MFYQPMLDVIMLNRKVAPRDFMTFCVIARHMDKGGENSFPKTSTIGLLLGITVRSVQRCVTKLEAEGYIKVFQRKRNVSVYTLGDKLHHLLQK